MLHLTTKNVENLRCTVCKGYLSLFPIYDYPGEKETRCGRCPTMLDSKPVRNVNYENLAKQFLFPCNNAKYGCIEAVLPDNVENHENECVFKKYDCPVQFPLPCLWTGFTTDFTQHYGSSHEELIVKKSKFEINLKNSTENNYLLNTLGNIFTILVKCNPTENKLLFCMYFIGDTWMAKQFTFQISIKAHNKPEKLTLSALAVESATSVMDVDDSDAQTSFDNIKNTIGEAETVVCIVNVIRKLPNELKEVENDSNIDSNVFSVVEDKLLQHLECPVCKEYMVSPIYQCGSGHSLCDDCRKKLTSCPICKSHTNWSIRNYTLEDITQFISYGCKNNGCSFTSDLNKLRNHCKVCSFGLYDCPYSFNTTQCNWKGELNSIIGHTKQVHQYNILTCDAMTVANIRETKCYLIIFDEQIFRILWKYEYSSNSTCTWCIQVINLQQNNAQYSVELDFLKNSEDAKSSFRIYDKCDSFLNRDETFKDKMKLSISMLRSIVGCEDIKCKIGFRKEL